MRFGELLKRESKELIVTPRHEKWLAQNSNATYSDRALAFAQREFTKEQRDRSGGFSSSSMGKCIRRQQFVFLGLPQLPPDTRTAQIFHNGTFMHLRWQMAGLTEGWLSEAEVPLGDNTLNMSGTMDGVLYESSVLELKSCNDRTFSQVLTFGAVKEHITQMAVYCEATERDHGVFIYENKNTQEYTEVLYEHTPEMSELVMSRAGMVWDLTYGKQLAEPLEKCIDRDGWVYKSCPFRDRCLGIHTWKDASEQVSG